MTALPSRNKNIIIIIIISSISIIAYIWWQDLNLIPLNGFHCVFAKTTIAEDYYLTWQSLCKAIVDISSTWPTK